MENQLGIPSHAVDRYRERVQEDTHRNERSDNQIRYIIGSAFRNAYVPPKFSGRTNLLVCFQDPDNKTSFGAYHLTIKKDAVMKNGGLVAMTIKVINKRIEECVD